MRQHKPQKVTIMARRSLGQHWQLRNTEEQRQFFLEPFTDLLEQSYADQIESFQGEKIVYGRENQDRNHAEVMTVGSAWFGG